MINVGYLKNVGESLFGKKFFLGNWKWFNDNENGSRYIIGFFYGYCVWLIKSDKRCYCWFDW